MNANRTWDELAVGDEASTKRVCAANDLYVFAHASGNLNPLHLPGRDENRDGRDDAVAPSMWVGALVSAVLGNILPGPGTLYRAQSFRFLSRVHVGDELTVRVRVREKRAKPCVVLDTSVSLADGTLVADGVAEVDAPVVKLTFPPHEIPELLVERHQQFDRMIGMCQDLEPLPTAVVAPEDKNSLGGAILGYEAGLCVPILIGAKARILDCARQLGADISRLEIVDIEDEHEAAARAVAMVHEGRVRAVMKGNIHSDDLLEHVVKKDGGLRVGRRISHVFVMDCPGIPHPLIISDAAINIAPDLETKVSIVQNAIDIALALGMDKPRVGILSAIETVNPAMPSTLDAAVLSKMAERGQIKGGIVDGPLAMDNAIDMEAARTKGITSLVAGRAQVLIAPNIESANMLAKELTFLAHAEAAGLVVGARVPVIMTSRADNDKSRLASCALALLYDYWRREGHPRAVLATKAAAE
ncbi:MAG: bifunctional enoyl-CoA hydratase/phosphate acetyltransferase [Bacteroidales bacterium]|nr:bifunctional enoyl-CoA hydratase/phosphate acetyltransferase [Bacteroidales bacterium]